MLSLSAGLLLVAGGHVACVWSHTLRAQIKDLPTDLHDKLETIGAATLKV